MPTIICTVRALGSRGDIYAVRTSRELVRTLLYMDIVTAHCHFDTDGGVPQYVATLVGNANYWQLTPSNSVTNPTRSR